jgi:Crinkler effector protein N-terminal domain
MSKLKFRFSLTFGRRGAAPALSSTSQTSQMFGSDIIINCLVLGDAYSRVFQVEIPINKSVAALRDAIKAKNTTVMKDIEAYMLTLYKVSIPLTPEIANDVAELGPDRLWLNPLSTLSEALGDGLPDGYVHVVIKTPGAWAYNYLSTLHLHVSQLHSCHLVSVESLRTSHNL